MPIDHIKKILTGNILIESGAVSVDDKEIKDFKAEVSWKLGQVIKVGKHRIYKLK